MIKTRALPRHAGIDVVAVLVTTAICLVGLSASLHGNRWMLVAGVGVTIGVLWSLLLVVLRGGTVLAAATLPVLYAVTAGAVALGSDGLFLGVPDNRTLGDVLVGTVAAWRRLVDTAPPVDSAGTVLLIPFFLTLVLSGLATAMATASRRPVLPVLPLLVMLGAVLVLGMQDPVSVLGQGLGFGAVALGWVGHRGSRIEAAVPAEDTWVDPALGRVSIGRVLVSAVVVLVAAGVVVPVAVGGDDPRQRWLLREAVQPYDSESVETPLADFRAFRERPAGNLADQHLFKVEGAPAGARLRLAVLDTYDGQHWLASSDRSPTDYRDRFLRVSSTIDNPGPGKQFLATIRAKRAWDLAWLPVVGHVQSFEFYDDPAGRKRSEIRYNRSTGTALLPDGLWKGDTYILRTRIGAEVLRPTMTPWPERDDRLWRAAEFLDVPARAWSLGAEEPMQQLLQVARRMRERGRYSNGADGWETRFAAGHHQQRLDESFVNAPMMVGNEEQYAATMALIANRLGVPARVVVGARLRDRGRVFGRDVTAWVEVRIANGSWRILSTDRFMSRRPPRQEAKPLPPVGLPPSAPKPSEKPTAQDQAPEPPKPPEKPRTKLEEVTEPRAWWGVLVPFVLLGLVAAAKAARRGLRRGATPASRRYSAAWDELLDTARDLGIAVAPTTRPRQASALAVPRDLAREADMLTFAEQVPTDDAAYDAADDYWGRIDEVAAGLSERVPAWRRVLARVNPVSLLPRHR